MENRPKKVCLVEINSLLRDAVSRLDELSHSDSEITGISTGFNDLDKMSSGWQNTDLIVIAGRPSMG